MKPVVPCDVVVTEPRRQPLAGFFGQGICFELSFCAPLRTDGVVLGTGTVQSEGNRNSGITFGEPGEPWSCGSGISAKSSQFLFPRDGLNHL